MKQALDFFETGFKVPIQAPYLEFLEKIASKGFEIELFRTDKITDFLGIL